MRKPKFTVEESFQEAKKYNARVEFFKGSPAAYATLQKRGLLAEACYHMPINPCYSYRRWTAEEVFEIASRYSSRSKFRRENEGAYAFALANKLLEPMCAHMRDGQKFWHVFELMAVAVKYQVWSEFIRSEPQAYYFANRHKLTNMASAHMRRHCVSWTKELVMAESAKHQSRGLFQISSPGAYKHADKHGYLDEACAHMPPPEYGFSKEKPSVLYHLRITLTDGAVLYKIGITNRDPEARVNGLRLFAGVKAEVLDVIKFDRGRDARMAEKRLHRRLAKFRYQGPPVMNNGNTELFTVNVFETYEGECHA